MMARRRIAAVVIKNEAHVVNVQVARLRPVNPGISDLYDEDALADAVRKLAHGVGTARTGPRGTAAGDGNVIGASQNPVGVLGTAVDVVQTIEAISNSTVVRPVPRFVEAIVGVQSSIIDKREQQHAPAMKRFTGRVGDIGRWECAVLLVIT